MFSADNAGKVRGTARRGKRADARASQPSQPKKRSSTFKKRAKRGAQSQKMFRHIRQRTPPLKNKNILAAHIACAAKILKNRRNPAPVTFSRVFSRNSQTRRTYSPVSYPCQVLSS